MARAYDNAAVALDALDPFNVKRQLERLDGLRGAAALATDAQFLRTARRQLLPLPLIDRAQRIDSSVFGPFESRPVPGLSGARIGLVGSGGSGACVALVGVKRAFEEAGIEPDAISVCSGSAIWGAMWAAGLSAQEMVDFSLSWQPQDYLDIQWTRLPRFALSALRGFTGLAKGEALEQLFDRRLWHMSAGETDVPLHTVVYNMDRGHTAYFGSDETPDLTLGELVRIAVALPLFVEAVRVEGDLYVDGGVVDAFPAEPMIADGGFDRVFGLNVLLPPGLEGEDISGWEGRAGGVLDASRQLRLAQHIELARRSRSRLGESLTLIEPIPHDDLHGFAFYDLFLDRSRWPDLMRRGYESTVAALEPFRRARRRRRRSPGSGAGTGATAGGGA
jgi:NTE family protein